MRRITVAFQTDKPLSQYGPLASFAEDLGFEGVSVYNDLYFQPAWLPLLEIARSTHWARIGPAAVNPFTCHPANIAANIALIDQAARGRAYLGLARGGWLDSLGLRPEKPIQALREAFECIRRILRGDRSAFEGEVFRLQEGQRRLRWEGVRADIPFLLGTWGRKTIEACIDCVQEVKLGGSANPFMVRSMKATLGERRKSGSVGLVVGAVTVVDEDAERARRLARREVALYLPVVARLDPDLNLEPELLRRIDTAVARGEEQAAADLISDSLLDKVALAGSPSKVADRALELFAAGADRLEFGTPHGLTENEGLRLLGKEVLPALRSKGRPL